jgi:hypothetical protein
MQSDDSMPRTPAYYLERATECERLANEAVTQENRSILLELATRWRALAAEGTSPG